MVAHEHGISERYAYLILSRSGITLADWVRTHRLAGAARELTRAAKRREREYRQMRALTSRTAPLVRRVETVVRAPRPHGTSPLVPVWPGTCEQP
jgi:hypothetical protein